MGPVRDLGSTPNRRHDTNLYHHMILTQAEYHSTGDELVLDNGEVVHISGSTSVLHIGCVTITWKAWELIQRRVRQIEGMR